MYKYRHLFFMPSFYLLITFSTGYLFYVVRLINWETAPVDVHLWSCLTILAAALSLIFHRSVFNDIINKDSFRHSLRSMEIPRKIFSFIVVSFFLIGMLGVAKFILDYSKLLGSIEMLFLILLEDTGQLRTYSDRVESAGVQISYFSWLAAFLIAVQLGNRKVSKWWVLLIVLIVLANSLFLDRTRPIWIIFMCTLLFFLTRYYAYSRKKILTFLTGITIFFIAVFLTIGTILGKGADDKNEMRVGLPEWTQPVFLYLSSSYAYFGKIIRDDPPHDYKPVRIAYPFQKVLAKFGWVNDPPSQVLDFYAVPLLTNVGTFLAPFYQDGGGIFVLLGILIHAFLFDMIVLHLLRRITLFSMIIVAMLCFIDFIGFFVPKIVSTPTWFLIGFCILLNTLVRRSSRKISDSKGLAS